MTSESGLDALFEGRGQTLSAPEVAELLALTKPGLYKWLKDGVIPGYKVGGTWFILRDELKETLRQGANAARGRDPHCGSRTTDDHRSPLRSVIEGTFQ
jgi:excisionase family DNA binding protein